MNNRQSTTAAFLENFGNRPDVIVKSCGRINILGEHTDYNDGFVLPAAIDKHIYFAASKNNSNTLRFIALDFGEQIEVDLDEIIKSDKSWANYCLGIVEQFKQLDCDLEGVDCVFGGDIPIGAGVSSSAALEGGLALCINTLFNIGMSKPKLALLAQRAEHEFVGMPCGIMDQFSTLMGKHDQVIQLDCRSLDYQYFPFKTSTHAIVLLNSKVSHALADSAYPERVQQCKEGLAIIKSAFPEVSSFRDLDQHMLEKCKDELGDLLFRRCDYVNKEIQRVPQACNYLLEGDFDGLGKLMFETHHGLRYDYEVSCAEIDFLVDFAMGRSEVLGSRIMGGGFGGCTINLVELQHVELFKAKASIAYKQAFGIDLDYLDVNIVDGTSVIG